MKKILIILTLAQLAPVATLARLAAGPIPAVTTTAPTRQKASTARPTGQPTILIVTPSEDTARDTRLWAGALRRDLGRSAILIRDVLAIDLLSYATQQDMIGQAEEKILARHQHRTWVRSEPGIERALDIPRDSARAFVFVLDAQGKVVARVEGEPTDAKVGQVEKAVRSTQ